MKLINRARFVFGPPFNCSMTIEILPWKYVGTVHTYTGAGLLVLFQEHQVHCLHSPIIEIQKDKNIQNSSRNYNQLYGRFTYTLNWLFIRMLTPYMFFKLFHVSEHLFTFTRHYTGWTFTAKGNVNKKIFQIITFFLKKRGNRVQYFFNTNIFMVNKNINTLYVGAYFLLQ